MNDRKIAYFSMEIALDAAMPTYSGGLGVLAGDTIRSAADLRVPMVAVTLLHRKGYIRQRIGPEGEQREEPENWMVEDHLQEAPQRVALELEGRTVHVRAWKYDVKGVTGFVVPVYLLDCDLPDNDKEDRALTDHLYGGDDRYRLLQEAVLGIGGVRMLRALGCRSLKSFHMNEGHSSLLTLELLDEEAKRNGREEFDEEDVELVREHCIFTTHTPVPAGHDKFPQKLVTRALQRPDLFAKQGDVCVDGELNMTHLALYFSRYVNGVAKKHREVSQDMFEDYSIDSITNGVHVRTWASPSIRELFDRHIPGWREDNYVLRYAISMPRAELKEAHRKAKSALIQHVNEISDTALDEDAFTIGFARRMTAYKRATLIFSDPDRLRDIAASAGRFQIVFAGKAHPKDEKGKQLIRKIGEAARALRDDVKIVYLENYDVRSAKLIVSGVDVWLNTPQPPLEASGTSGMKAAVNGIPSLSTPDGWWLEGHIEGVTGWSIGNPRDPANGKKNAEDEAAILYYKLENVILPLYYHDFRRYLDIMRHCIALNASFFNSQRMVAQYAVRAYLG